MFATPGDTMRFRFQEPRIIAALMASLVAAGGPVRADTAEPLAGGEPAPPSEPAAASAPVGEKVEYGVGFRLRNIRAPRGMLEWFVEHTPGGVNNGGVGVDLIRRRGNTELQLGFEFDRIQPAEGVWIESNSNVAAGDEADYIVGPDKNGGKRLGWFTIELTFLNHTPLHEKVALRYGAGLGLGIVTGELGRYDVFCVGATNEDPEPGCVPTQLGGRAMPTGDTPGQVNQYDLPPVFPVINAILGVQIRPVSKLTINVEGGIRTFPFVGASGAYFF
jgi:hypothetical protein